MWKKNRLLTFGTNLSKKYRIQLLDAAAKTGLDILKLLLKKVGHKTAAKTGNL